MNIKPITNISFKRYNPFEFKKSKKDINKCGLQVKLLYCKAKNLIK